MEREDKRNELFITDANAEFAVEQITSGLGQRRLVNSVNRLMERFDVEQAVLHISGVILEPLIDAPARAGGFAELATGGDLFGLDAADGFFNERMVIGQARKRGCGRLASGSAQDFVLALGDSASIFVHPGEGVVAIGGAHINHDAGVRSGNVGVVGSQAAARKTSCWLSVTVRPSSSTQARASLPSAVRT